MSDYENKPIQDILEAAKIECPYAKLVEKFKPRHTEEFPPETLREIEKVLEGVVSLARQLKHASYVIDNIVEGHLKTPERLPALKELREKLGQ